jgi:hypothetical protein
MDASASAVLGSPTAANSVGQVVFTLIDANNVVQDHKQIDAAADATAAAAVFVNVLPGTYTISAARTDGTGASVAPAVFSAPFTITAPSTVTIPLSVAVSVV